MFRSNMKFGLPIFHQRSDRAFGKAAKSKKKNGRVHLQMRSCILQSSNSFFLINCKDNDPKSDISAFCWYYLDHPTIVTNLDGVVLQKSPYNYNFLRFYADTPNGF